MTEFEHLAAIALIAFSFIAELAHADLLGPSEINCDDLRGLCLEEKYHFDCSVPISFPIHHVELHGPGNCKKTEIKFQKDGELVFETDTGKSCGKVKALSSQNNSTKTIKVTLTPTNYTIGTQVKCFGQSTNNSYRLKNCSISLGGLPLPPSNLSNSDCSVMWDQPSSNSKADEQLSYFVTVNSSLGFKSHNTSERFIILEKEGAAEDIVNYTVCVAAKNCFGLSSPVCKNMLIVINPLPPPHLNATILNSTTVLLSLEPNSSAAINSNELCFDIERNFRIKRRCVSQTEIILNMKKENIGIHTFRVRANLFGKFPGRWSNPACITFAPPLPFLFINHTIVNSGPHSNATLNLTIELLDSSKVVGFCHIPQILEIDISIRGTVYEMLIPRNSTKQKISFKLQQESEQQMLKISATPVSVVGPGPEQVTYVYIPSDPCHPDKVSGAGLSGFSPSVVIGTLLLSFLVMHVLK